MDFGMYSDLTKRIIGCAYKVYGVMGFGFLESVYEKSLAFELKKEGLWFETQKAIQVFYQDEIVGNYVADILVENAVLVELKSVRNIVKAHEIQLVNYLAATKTPVGLLLNFGESNVEVKRKLWKLPRETGRLNHNPVNPVNPVKGF